MKYAVPPDSFDEELKDEMNKKLSELQACEKFIPAVFIVHDLVNESLVYMSEKGLSILGITLDEIKLPINEYHDRFFNPEDVPNYVPKVFGLIERNNTDEMVTFFQQVRSSPNEDWTWYLSATKIFMRDKNEKPLLTLTLAIPIDSKHHITTKVERLLQENNFLRQHQHLYASLTKREIEILKQMALGMNSSEIAAQLHISEKTASTHRRNIRSKLNAQTNYDITRFAQAFDLI